ncbi:MAG: hypothetical protein ACK5EA_17590 [Planctomycetaceae bacterium]
MHGWTGWGALWVECVAFAAGLGLALLYERQGFLLGRKESGIFGHGSWPAGNAKKE